MKVCFAKGMVYPILDKIEAIPVHDYVPGKMEIKFSCRRVVIHEQNLFKAIYPNPDDRVTAILEYLARRHPKAARKRKNQSKWRKRAFKAVFNKKYTGKEII